MSTPVGRQDVVVGAGLGGLTAARALANYFERVTVLERDALPPDAAHRAGTPQARHVHVVLGGGQRALGELFPGFEQDLAGAGTVRLGWVSTFAPSTPSTIPFPSAISVITYSMSRAAHRAHRATKGPGWGLSLRITSSWTNAPRGFRDSPAPGARRAAGSREGLRRLSRRT